MKSTPFFRAVAIFTLIVGAPLFAFGECSREEVAEIIECSVTEALIDCFTEDSACELEDVDNSIAAGVIQSFISAPCCEKKATGAKLACLKLSGDALKARGEKGKSVKRVLPGPVRQIVSDGLKELFNNVKENGECYIEEDEEEIDEDEELDDEL
jgi:hypothetical protein